MLVDTHCHVHFNAYKDDSDEVIRRAFSNGVRMITVGTQKDTSANGIKTVEKYETGIWCSIGLHPNHLYSTVIDEAEGPAFMSRSEDFDYTYYKNLAQSSKKVVAIGECGLDYYRIPENLNLDEIKAKQQKVFREHIHLATELDLPLIVHIRDGSTSIDTAQDKSLITSAHEDVINILHDEIHQGNLGKRGVIHCYSGDWEQAKRYFDLGFLISFTGTAMFGVKKGQRDILKEVIEESPLEKIMVETDSPYLTPSPYRGKRNEPSYVKFVAEHIAKIKELDFEEVSVQTTKNAIALFNLK